MFSSFKANADSFSTRLDYSNELLGGRLASDCTPLPVSSLGVDEHRSLFAAESARKGTFAKMMSRSSRETRKYVGSRKLQRNRLSRQQQCRINQARYRNRQQQRFQDLENGVKQLQQEIRALKRQRRCLTSNEVGKQNPWSITTEVFQLLQTCFRSPWSMAGADEMVKHPDIRRSLMSLRDSVVDGVSMGEVHGVDALLEQLTRYSTYFGNPLIQLDRVKEVAPGTMRLAATLNLTITKFTMRRVFSRLVTSSIRTGECELEEHRSLRRKLTDARLRCKCSLTFFFDEDGRRIERVETSIGLIAALATVLGSLQDVATTLELAPITSDGVIDIAKK